MTPRATSAALAALLLVPLAPGVALADTPTPSAVASAGAEPSSLPSIAQTNPGFQQQGCVHSSARTTDRTPWAQTFLRPDAAWPLSQGAGVTVAVLGSGVDGTSGVLGGRLALGPREYGPGDSGRDCVGHGTFLAGLIAAGRQDGLGFAGVAPGARILAVAVTDDVGNTAVDQVSRGIRAAADAGARVIDLAVPLPAGNADLSSALHYADGKGALVIAPSVPDPSGSAAGAASAAQPPTDPDVLAVGDLGPGGSPPSSPSPSPSAAPAPRVDLTAPGDAVMSVGPGGVGYFTGSGPSFAAAFVAGTAALVLGYRPDLTREQLLHRLEATAYHPGTALPDPQLGYGTVDPVAAVSAVLPEEHAPATPHPQPPTGSTAMPPAPPQPAARQAAAVAGGALGMALLVGCAAVVLPRGRRRNWRPGAS
ncbi:membrane-anchored mycosin MYCP [Kitasatospora sp. MAA4]|uniref:S8 family serine peptidase n=1 Tax=Kitasatospora sp. MAA4 TaxID=3035093 RepID=UPI0024731568|nr:S8 family serine peptidase [Kitasatospora sp. MAA4]MDH6133283.1 membrane-anchored mycosin MYCP [Kitasatospora sp. MAA4]